MRASSVSTRCLPGDNHRVLIERVDVPGLLTDEDDLVELLRACVHAGASLGFLAPLSRAEAVDYWRSLHGEVTSGTRVVIIARDGDRILGTGQLRFETKDNGRHRAEIAKVMVNPDARRCGVGTRLMQELEAVARQAGIVLLYLDTSDGPGGARELYEALGWSHAGGVPGYALDPDGTPADNLIFYKRLD